MNSPEQPNQNRRIRVFVSSTFRDMMGERDELMTHAWPELRRFCRERHVELVEVDLRWGIAEEQSTRKETLKLCLDEIRACRPFFIGLLGERYGWVPGDDAFTGDLLEEQPWLAILRDRSVTELEIIHGVLREVQMHKRAFFYFRDPSYLDHLPPGTNRADFESEGQEAKSKLNQLKQAIRHARDEGVCKLHEAYPDRVKLAALVLEDLKAAIEAQFPIEKIPDALTRDARDHEAFAETRRRTYIGRPDYFETLDRHAAGDGAPLILLGDSGSGKSALLANWLAHWHGAHPKDFIFQHYIGSTPDSAEHWRLMGRLIAEIKRWTDDPEELPKSHDDLLKTFPVWLAKARIKAERDGVRCLLVLDALNQLEDRDHAHLLGWLPAHPFTGALRLVVSTLPGDTLEAVTPRDWKSLRVEPLTLDERHRMIAHYLARFGKKLDARRLERIAAMPAAANPLYLKILLDELRVTGTHERLDERLTDYLAATDIPTLLKKVLARYQHDYERDRPGLVSEALGLMWAARRGLTETELLRLLKPANLPQLPLAAWTPLRSAMEENMVDRSGILNFAHDFLRTAVEAAFVPDKDKRDELRLRLADDFEQQAISARSCDELPWLLWQANQRDRLRACLLDIGRFLLIRERDQGELMRHWVWLHEERTMGAAYLNSFDSWSHNHDAAFIASVANIVGFFLFGTAGLHAEAERLMRRALAIDEQRLGSDHPEIAGHLNNLGCLLRATSRIDEAEPLLRRALAIDEQEFGSEHPNVAIDLNSLAQALQESNRLGEAEPLFRRALAIDENSFGVDSPNVAIRLNNLAVLLKDSNRLEEAEPLLRRALANLEQRLGPNHPDVAASLNNLACLLHATNRLEEAELLYRRALASWEKALGEDHPNVASGFNNLASLLQDANRLTEAESLIRRAMAMDERRFGPHHSKVAIELRNLASLLLVTKRLVECETLLRRALAITEGNFGPHHPGVAGCLNDLAQLLRATNRLAEAEPLMRRSLAIDEKSLGPEHPDVARDLNNLGLLLQTTNRLAEAEPLMRRMVLIFLKFTAVTGHQHLHLLDALRSYTRLCLQMSVPQEEFYPRMFSLCAEAGLEMDGALKILEAAYRRA
ncbi:MAG: tetratricopeptide repeat protein [Verrucomicrobiaceae bacterium]|nr:tetratricopeptide repeat protein [Verrucomicrobiaceae bacterium]